MKQIDDMRDDLRRHLLLKTHLEAGQWKAEAWCLADSLLWALGAVVRPADERSDQDVAEHQLAADRLARVREALGCREAT